MGNAAPQKVVSVQAFANACELAPWVSSVKGVSGVSTSISDQWLLTLRHNSVVYDGVPLQQVFLKIVPEQIKHADPNLNKGLNELHREIFIYANIIKPVIDQHICPFFLPVINVSYNCSSEALIAMLSVGGPTPEFDPQQVFLRNMTLILHGNDGQQDQCFFADKEPVTLRALKQFQTGEPAARVSNPENRECIERHAPAILSDQRYTLLVTKAIHGNLDSKTYITQLWETQQLQKLHQFYFQVSIGFLVLILKKVHHNDLHFQNILVEQLPKSESVVYGIKNVVYSYSTDVVPLIFDFDRSRCVQLKDDFGDEEQLYRDLFTDSWCFFFATYAYTKDPVIPQCLFHPDDLAEGTALWDTTIANNPATDMMEYIEVGKTIAKAGLDLIQNDFLNVVDAFAELSEIVNSFYMDDPELFQIRNEGSNHRYYISSELTTGADPNIHVLGDVVAPLHLALHSDQVKEALENSDKIIRKKQQLALNKLTLLQLKLELARKK